MKYLIIGNSAAGTGALEAIRKCDQEGTVTILSDEKHRLYSRCLLSYYLAGIIDETALSIRPDNFHKDMNAELVTGVRVDNIDTENRKAIGSNGEKYDYDRLLIATGASAKLPANIPSGMSGIHVLRTIDDAGMIEHRIKKNGIAVILGGGLVGLKAAFALNKRSMKVYVVLRSPHVLSQMIDFEAAQIVKERMLEGGIEVLTGSDISQVETTDGEIKSVAIAAEDGKEIQLSCDILIAAKGVTPNINLIENSGIEKDWGILTDSNMRTNVEDIYAAGDVAETMDIATGKRTVNALWTCAVHQGKTAGFNMAGTALKYDGSVGMNSLNFTGVDLISFGVVRPKDEPEYEILTYSNPYSNVYKKIVLKDNVIKGLILVNNVDNAGILLSLLSKKTNVSGFKGSLLKDNFNFGKIVNAGGARELKRFWNAGLVSR